MRIFFKSMMQSLIFLIFISTLFGCREKLEVHVSKEKPTVEFGSVITEKLLSSYMTSNKDNTNYIFRSSDDFNKVGTYTITALAYHGDVKPKSIKDAEATLDFEIQIEDTQNPTLVEKADVSKQLAHGSQVTVENYFEKAFDLIANEEKPITTYVNVSNTEWDQHLKEIKLLRKEKHDRIYDLNLNTTITEEVSTEIANSCIVFTHNIDSSIAGEYEIKAYAVDENYNTSEEVIIKINVLEKPQETTQQSTNTQNYNNNTTQNNNTNNQQTNNATNTQSNVCEFPYWLDASKWDGQWYNTVDEAFDAGSRNVKDPNHKFYGWYVDGVQGLRGCNKQILLYSPK